MYQNTSWKNWTDSRLPIQYVFRNPQKVFPLHFHDFHEIFIVLSGIGTLMICGNHQEIKSGDVFCIKPKQIHGFKNVVNLVVLNIRVAPPFLEENNFDIRSMPGFSDFFGSLQDKEGSSNYYDRFRLDPALLSEVLGLFRSAYQELSDALPGYQTVAIVLFFQILVLLFRARMGKSPANIRFGREARNLIDYVKKNFKKRLTINTLVSVSDMSESQIFRAFKFYTGYSPITYINILRINAASRDLIETTKSVTDIALDMGFHDSNYFCRCFKKHLGLSPQVYRTHSCAEQGGGG
ncbi:MAG: helix-turn-helix domain-containing protein [Treponema sp.]|jgi:AraC-like DNA-binding protein/mannose-6-phosphate isomerase-like protein (cupin superfamily)|nr:helix-turn-helix domain-containing protein [Treponema sp.]